MDAGENFCALAPLMANHSLPGLWSKVILSQNVVRATAGAARDNRTRSQEPDPLATGSWTEAN